MTEMLNKAPDELLRNAAHHIMDRTNIWYDRTMNKHGDLMWGPDYKAVTMLCRLASDIRAGVLS